MKKPCRSRAPWVLLALLLAMMACAPEDEPPRFYREDFETLCDGVPCGWQRIVGDEDQAVWVETVHPGEHGLRLTGNVTVRGPGTMDVDEPVVAAALSARVAARCDSGSTLRFDIVLADSLGTQSTSSTAHSPPAEWGEPLVFWPSPVPEPASGTLSRVVAIGITKAGAGACEISDIAIDDLLPGPGC